MADAAGRARRQELLETMRAEPGDWPTGRVRRFYQANGWGPNRSVARRDLRLLTASGLLLELSPDNARVYRLNHARDPRLGPRLADAGHHSVPDPAPAAPQPVTTAHPSQLERSVMTTRTQPWFVSLEDSVSALGAAARECQAVYRAAVLAKGSADLDRLRLHDGKVIRRTGSLTADHEPHLAALSRIGSALLDQLFQATNLYDEAARAYAHGANWAIRQVLAGQQPAHVELEVEPNGVHYVLTEALPLLQLDRYVGTAALETARRTYERCLVAQFEADGIASQSHVADHEASAMHEALDIAAGIPDAAYAYGVQAEAALSYALLPAAGFTRE